MCPGPNHNFGRYACRALRSYRPVCLVWTRVQTPRAIQMSRSRITSCLALTHEKLESFYATILLLATLLLSFSLSMMFMMSHDDLVAADQREAQFQQFELASRAPLSYKLFYLMMSATSKFFGALLLPLFGYLAFLLTTVFNTDTQYIDLVHLLVVCVSFVITIMGLFDFFFACLVLVEASFPRYMCVSQGGHDPTSWGDRIPLEHYCDGEDGWYDTATLEVRTSYLPASASRPTRGVMQSMATGYVKFANTAMVALIVGLVVLVAVPLLSSLLCKALRKWHGKRRTISA